MTHLCVWHDSFMCETWLIHVWDMIPCLTSCPRHIPAYRWVMSLHTLESCRCIFLMQVEHASRTRCKTRHKLTVSQSTKLRRWKNDELRQSCDEWRQSCDELRQSCDGNFLTNLWRIYAPMYMRIYFKIMTFDKVVIFHDKIVKNYDFRQSGDVSQSTRQHVQGGHDS